MRARVGGASQALAAPAEEFEPALALPGWFAGEPPAEFVALLEEIAAAVRSDRLRTQLFAMGEADQRDLELEIERLNSKLKGNSDKLYGGRVHNPRELEDLSKEVDQDRRAVQRGIVGPCPTPSPYQAASTGPERAVTADTARALLPASSREQRRSA